MSAPDLALDVRAATKRYGERPALDGVSLRVAPGEYLAVLGPSGCGKSTLLRLVAGFEALDAGAIRVGGRAVAGPGLHVPPERRGVGLVFQSYALWPHMSVASNIGYPLKVAGLRGAAREARVERALATVGLAGLGGRDVAALSGGQRQRVALARCLVAEPALVLLDEPLANLDAHLREAMQAEFADFRARTGTTMVHVTHDQAEAMALADRVAVLDAGRLAQVAAPATLYREPASAMVAGFVGTGALVPAVVLAGAVAGRCRARLLGVEAVLRCAPGQPPGPALACLRPEDLEPVAGAPGETLPLRGALERVAYQGGHHRASARVLGEGGEGAPPLVLRLPEGVPNARGAEVALRLRDGWVVPA